MLFAKFYDRLIKTNETNPKTGLPIFKEVCFVEVRIKNNMTDIVDQPATQEKIRQFPREYQLYLASKEKLKEGTDLKMFAHFSPKDVATLNAHGIFSVEEFVALSEEKAIDFGLHSEWQKAKTFLSLSKNQADMTRLEAEISTLKEENERLKAEIQTLSDALKTASNQSKRKKKSKTTEELSNDAVPIKK